MQGESADAESGQLDGVQQGDLGHAVCLCAPAGPVLVALNLGEKDGIRQRLVVSEERISEVMVPQLELQEQPNIHAVSLSSSSAHALPPSLENPSGNLENVSF